MIENLQDQISQVTSKKCRKGGWVGGGGGGGGRGGQNENFAKKFLKFIELL